MKEIFSKEELEKEVKSGKPVILDIFTTTCYPCKLMVNSIADVEKKYPGKITFLKVDAHKNRWAIDKFNVRNVPTIIFYNVTELTPKPQVDYLLSSGYKSSIQIESDVLNFYKI